MTTNQYNQPTDSKGHVIKESERIAKAIESIVGDGEIGKETLKELTAYVMNYAHTEWSKNVNMGIALGRKDAITMLKAAIDSKQSIFPPNGVYNYSVVAVPLDELQKIITALEETA